MKNLYRALLSTALIASASFSASANLITNGSFELGNDLNESGWEVYQSLDDGDGNTTDWTTISGAGIEIQANGTGTIDAQDLDYKVELDSHNGNGGASGVTTNTLMAQLVEGLTVNAFYELSVWYSPRTSDTNTNAIFAYAGDEPDVTSNPGKLGEMIAANKGWVQYSFVFQATAVDMLVGFGAQGSANTIGGYIDNVSLTKVPAPSSVALLAMVIFALRVFAKRK
ncbi:hypothetical protein KJ365_13385 [Glaciecola sp. XM2]|jgi:hypothetical protein|uniref:hypothetical protein n=1 Tax=Glaciecola sp. XM2 TaxID=1914931 RepID=UPI001BDEFBEF|nr:hypothetical protein [Glaciecola sp. XM2]MBT1451880.1 hypothetical protein [Glaciecola sp. XM2]